MGTSLSGARGTATTPVEAEQQALQQFKAVTANPVQEIVNAHVTSLLNEFEALPEPGAAESAARFKALAEARRDEKLLARVVGRIKEEADLLEYTKVAPHEEKVGLTTAQERAVARLAGYREGIEVHPTTRDEPRFYEDFVLKEPIIVDPAFKNGHGSMMHTIDDLVVAAAFEREGIPMTGYEWRQSLNDPNLSPRAQALQKQLWEEIFDSNRVAPDASGANVGSLNRPETLNPILDEILGGLNKFSTD